MARTPGSPDKSSDEKLREIEKELKKTRERSENERNGKGPRGGEKK